MNYSMHSTSTLTRAKRTVSTKSDPLFFRLLKLRAWMAKLRLSFWTSLITLLMPVKELCVMLWKSMLVIPVLSSLATIHRIIQPIQSRCQVFTDFTPPIGEYAKRISFILRQEKIQVGKEQIEKIKEVIRYHYPDLRRIINYIQRSVVDGVLSISSTINNEGFAQEILDKTVNKEDLMSVRKFVIESEQTFGNDYPKLMKDLFNAVYKSSISEDKKRLALLQVSEYLYRSALVMDQEINFFSCLIALASVV